MKEFKIYNKKSLQPIAIKDGWSWPAFFFNWFWGLIKGLWSVSAIAFFLYVFFVVVYSQLKGFPSGVEFGAVDIMGFIGCVIYAGYGNQWRENKLKKTGYNHAKTITAKNHKKAIEQFKATLKEDKPNAPKVELENKPKESVFIDEEEAKTEIETTLDSPNNSDNIKKLKEAKSLLDDELINKDDYEKIKKKIIENL